MNEWAKIYQADANKQKQKKGIQVFLVLEQNQRQRS